MADTTILITGVAGFLGSHLAEKGLKLGHKVIGLDNFSTGQQSNVEYLRKISSEKFHFQEFDVCQNWQQIQNSLPKAWLTDLKQTFHFASPASPPNYQRLGLETMWVNSIGLNHALQFSDNYRAKVTFASTSEIYGDPQVSIQNEEYRGWVNTVGPRACYDEAKRFGESLIYTHNLKNQTQHGIVRIFNTYGPRMNPNDGRVIINFLLQALESTELIVYGDGSQTRSFCFVDDLINGIWAFANQDQFSGPVNIGNQDDFSVLELAHIVRSLFPNKTLSIKHLPPLVDDPQKRKPDLSLAKEKLRWSPEIDLKTGLSIMLDSLKHLPNDAAPHT
jgi:nucleoside-diphosphate-sugar epimerase